MTPQKALKLIMKNCHMPQMTVSALSGIAQTTISALTRRDGMMSTYIKVFNALGYELVVRPHSRNVPDYRSYKLTLGDEDTKPISANPSDWYNTTVYFLEENKDNNKE